NAAVGVFGGAGAITGGFGVVAVGVEGRVKLHHDLVLGGSGAYNVPTAGGPGFATGNGYLAYYLSPRTKLVGDVFVSGAAPGTAGFQGSVHHQLHGGPVILFAGLGAGSMGGISGAWGVGGVRLLFDSNVGMQTHDDLMAMRHQSSLLGF
ncbi:MAG: hypothetical protein ACTSYE_00570, partial [Alphaproteobacteria bacterium]